MPKTKNKTKRIRTLVAVGVFSALAYVCCVLFHFKASFLTFDLKDAIMTIGAMFFGPVYGSAMSLIVAIIEALTISDTGPYGFIMNVLSSTTFVCIGSIVYCSRRTLGGALMGLVAASISTVAVMMGANLLITPYYMSVSVSEVKALIPTLLLPFNATKVIFNSAVVFLLYKPVSLAVRSAGFVPVGSDRSMTANTSNSKKRNLKQILIIVIALTIAALSLIYFFRELGGNFMFA